MPILVFAASRVVGASKPSQLVPLQKLNESE